MGSLSTMIRPLAWTWRAAIDLRAAEAEAAARMLRVPRPSGLGAASTPALVKLEGDPPDTPPQVFPPHPLTDQLAVHALHPHRDVQLVVIRVNQLQGVTEHFP
jgi:hypothetical protein